MKREEPIDYTIRKEHDRKWEAQEKRAEFKIWYENLINNRALRGFAKILGLAALLYVGEEYSQRNIPGLKNAYHNFYKTIELAPEMISDYFRGDFKEDYEFPTINELNNPEGLSDKKKKSPDNFFDEIKPIIE